MPLPLPSASNGYAVTSAYAIDVANWNAAFGDFHSRMLAREALEADFIALIAEGVTASVQTVQDTIAPQMQAIQTNLADLTTDIEDAADQVIAILSGTVSANIVQDSETRVMVSPAQRDAIADKADMSAVSDLEAEIHAYTLAM